MKISIELPPNYRQIIDILGDVGNAVFCYGDTIYNPFNRDITPDIEIHEEVHSRQQGNNPEIWYINYLTDRDFRLKQEVEAYGTQYAFAKKHVKNKEVLRWAFESMSDALSGKELGRLVTKKRARKLIEIFAKTGKIM